MEHLQYQTLDDLHRQLEQAATNECYEQAEWLSWQILSSHPGDNDCLGILMETTCKSQRWHNAGSIIHTLIQKHPQVANLYFYLGIVYKKLENPQAALDCYQRCLALGTNNRSLQVNMVNCYNAIGKNYFKENRLEEAIACYQTALEIDPQSAHAHNNMALSLLKLGDLLQGFSLYEWRKQLEPRHYLYQLTEATPEWQGEYFSQQNLLLYQDQGLGDVIQFMRYLPDVKARGGTVTLLVQEALVSLCENLPWVDDVLPVNMSPSLLNAFDLSLPITSLGRIFGTSLRTIPNTVPYIQPPATLSAEIDNLLSPLTTYKVGLVWAGNTSKGTIEGRSFAFSQYFPFASLSGITFVSLQKGEEASQIQHRPPSMHLLDLSPYLENLSVTAGIIAKLDLVITIDTSVAHLAGALGKPVWVLLPYATDWRWFIERNDSPWYPTMRLFRQTSPGNWDEVVEKVARELSVLPLRARLG